MQTEHTNDGDPYLVQEQHDGNVNDESLNVF